MSDFIDPNAQENKNIDSFAGLLATERGGDDPIQDAPEQDTPPPAPVYERPEPPAVAPQGAAEDSQEEPTDEPGEHQEPPSYVFTLLEGDEEKGITADEAKAGYLRRADYSKKTQELADQRATFEQESVAQRQQLNSLLQTALVHAQAGLAEFAGVDFERLEREDPVEAERLQAEYYKRAQRYGEVESIAAALQQQQQAWQAQQHAKLVEAEREKAALHIPELADEGTAKTFATNLIKYAESQGFSPQEVAGIADHRALIALDKARRYDELMGKRASSKKTPGQSATKTLRPGTSGAAPAASKQQQRMSLLKEKELGREQRDELAVDYFADLLRSGRK